MYNMHLPGYPSGFHGSYRGQQPPPPQYYALQNRGYNNNNNSYNSSGNTATNNGSSSNNNHDAPRDRGGDNTMGGHHHQPPAPSSWGGWSPDPARSMKMCMQPRSFAELTDEKARTWNELQRHDADVRKLLAQYTEAHENAMRTIEHDPYYEYRYEMCDGRDELAVRVGDAVSKERRLMLKLGELSVEIQCRERWCQVNQELGPLQFASYPPFPPSPPPPPPPPTGFGSRPTSSVYTYGPPRGCESLGCTTPTPDPTTYPPKNYQPLPSSPPVASSTNKLDTAHAKISGPSEFSRQHWVSSESNATSGSKSRRRSHP